MPVVYRHLNEQQFWDEWGHVLMTALSPEEFEQLGVDFRSVMRTQWWEWRREHEKS